MQRWMYLCRSGAALALVYFVSQPAMAAGEVSGQVGAAYAVATGASRTFVGPTFAIRGAWRPAPAHALGAVFRYHLMFASDGAWPNPQSEHHLALDYRFSIGSPESIHPLVGASAGASLWDGCINGDLCGGVGFIFGGLVGLGIPISPLVAVDILFETNIHTGMPNGVEYMFLPTLWSGVTLRF